MVKARNFIQYLDIHAFIRLQTDSQFILRQILPRFFKQIQFRCFEIDHDFRTFGRQTFTSTQVEWHTGPAPVINVDADRHESFCIAALVRALFFQISRHFFALGEARSILPAYGFFAYVGAVDAAQRLQYFHFFIADAVCAQVRRRRHRNHAKNLQQVVLDHVAHLTGFIKIAPAPFDPHFFCHGNLNMINGAIVPVIHKQGVSKTQRQQVQHRFFTKIVVDTVNLALLEVFANLIIDFLRGRQRRPQRFLHDYACRFSIQFCLAKPFANCAKSAGRHGKVVNGDTIFLIQHRAETAECSSVIDIEITKIQTCTQGVP